MDRRSFLRTSAALLAAEQLSHPALHALTGQAPASTAVEPALAPWSPGYLEIHHIATNRGNAAFFIQPDGTTPYLSAPLPSDQRRPGVVRVDPGGATFRVHILSNQDETDRVTATFGPYTA